MKNKKLLITIIILLTLTILIAGTLFLFNYLNKEEPKPEYVFNFTDVEYPYGFKWGITREEVEDQILAKGLYKETSTYQHDKFLKCIDNNFQNILGLKCNVVFVFNDNTELTDVAIKISFSEQKFDFTEDEFYNAYKKELNKNFGSALEDIYSDYDYSDTWFNDETIILAIINESENRYSYFYSDKKLYPEVVDFLEQKR